MLLVESMSVHGFEEAISGMRNPMNSWAKSDTEYFDPSDKDADQAYKAPTIGPKDYDLMERLISSGTDHRKFLRMIVVYMDISAPLYWWKEFDTYKVGTVANSCSTMHKITANKFCVENFSHDHLDGKTRELFAINEKTNADAGMYNASALDFLYITCDVLNHYRSLYLETHDKKYWWQIIQLLPSSYNQKRTVMLNYEVLRNIYFARMNHKLDEWHTFCDWIEALPYSHFITMDV